MTVGLPLPHDSAPLHVTGRARYVDDIPLPANTLHLAFGMATIARGSITSIDLTQVRAAPGVMAVLTAQDLPFTNDVSPSIHDEPLLSDGSIHYRGQPIFVVAATSHLAARKAARRAQRLLVGHATDLEMDNAGRISIPPVLRTYAALDKRVMLIGQGHRFEIWSEDNWNQKLDEMLAEDDEGDEGLPEQMKHLVL